MKKLLILMLVLGMASIAAATPITCTLSLTTADPIVQGTTITVQLKADQKIWSVGNIDFTTDTTGNDMTLGSWQASPATSDNGTLNGDADLIDDASAGWTSPYVAADTVIYEFDVYYDAAGWVSATDVGTYDLANPDWDLMTSPMDEQYYVAAYSNLYLPEPMTVALLGFGALFLRRRK
jgi:hypothetical protein